MSVKKTIEALRPQLDELFKPVDSPCGFCGDTTLGQRHRVIDSLAGMIRAGEPWESAIAEWDFTVEHAIVALAVTKPRPPLSKGQNRQMADDDGVISLHRFDDPMLLMVWPGDRSTYLGDGHFHIEWGAHPEAADIWPTEGTEQK